MEGDHVTDSGTLAPQPPAGMPVPASRPRDTDVLGRRVVAALIDLAILTVVLVLLAATIGEFDLAGVQASVTLDGVPALPYFGLVFLYYLGFEVATGRTVGKLLVGLQVVGNDWARPSAGHVVVRTVLRAVDGLPVFYLVGFVVMLATGERRQRLGDLAASTIVVRAAPIRYRGLVAVLLVVALVSGAVLSFATLANPSTTHQAHGVTFEYPVGWRDVTDDTTRDPADNEIWSVTLHATETDGVAIVALPTQPEPITADKLDAVKQYATPFFRELYALRGGSMRDGPSESTVAGLPALRYQGDELFNGTPVEVTRVRILGATTEYLFACQYTRAHAAEITQGCEQILSTFAVGSASEHEAARA